MIGGVRRYVMPSTGDGVGPRIPNEPGLVPVALYMLAWTGATFILQGELLDGTFAPIHTDRVTPGTFAVVSMEADDAAWLVIPEGVREALTSFGAWRVDSAGNEDGLILLVSYAPLYGFR